MRKLKLYLETSIFNLALAEDAPFEREATLKLLQKLLSYEIFVSDIVIDEINRTQNKIKKERLLDLVNQLKPEALEFDESAKALADKYIQEGIIPQKYAEDAFHIAIASVNDLDALISWNFKHIVKLKTKREVAGINAFMGYKEIEIYSPLEVSENV